MDKDKEKDRRTSAEFLELLDLIDEPVQVALLEAMVWLSQLPSGQPWPSLDEIDTIIESIVAKKMARENGSIN